MMKITMLGTGTSIGVPEMLCDCPVCCSTDPHDKRLRTSALIETATTKILLDCGPDFRQQVLVNGIDRLDGVFLTHEHYDHVAGIDDLRPFCKNHDVDIFAEQFVIDHLMQRIPYCFGVNKYPGTPSLVLNAVAPGDIVQVGDIKVEILRVFHGKLPIVGFKIGNMAYITDIKTMPREEMDKIMGIKYLFVTALHMKEHPTHQNLEQAIGFVRDVHAENAWFLHMSHRIGFHSETDATLPCGMHLAFDGLQINID